MSADNSNSQSNEVSRGDVDHQNSLSVSFLQSSQIDGESSYQTARLTPIGLKISYPSRVSNKKTSQKPLLENEERLAT